VYLYSAKK